MKKMIMLILTATVLAACGQSDDTSSSDSEVVQPIRADLNVPEKGDTDETVTFKVTVTQDGKAVKDADEVKFEIWREGSKDDSEMIEANNMKDGAYTVENTFTGKGIYYIQSHVTAKQMHTMPKAKINIGNAQASKDKTDKEQGHHHSQTTVKFHPPEKITADESAAFTATVSTKQEPLSAASVTMEIWQESDEKHDWVTMTEQNAGTYQAKTTFKNSGTYKIKVHVKKGDIHYHNVFKINADKRQ
ncbi:FixH family protein [Virgibacillus ihumii]|uniref:FixH family protein n=1 Tax=Virgibacillus ihumii TaxID=2686091 RepID=UPI00157D46F8|nr:FixH family protein [Virgibacillus ihumii]